jgi:adenine-specific DNA-methyltransferase
MMSDTFVQHAADLLLHIDETRILANNSLQPATKVNLGQFMTPASIARFMASLFPIPEEKQITLLDPGAGIGSLSSAFVEYISRIIPDVEINIDAFEIDPIMRNFLQDNLTLCENMVTLQGGRFCSQIISDDFILETTKNIFLANSLWAKNIQKYTHCIMNPPYKKIASSSNYRNQLHSIGIETVNLYTAFIALALKLLRSKAILVAIIPRSFCNGPYYKSFRKDLLQQAAIKHLHIFKTRNTAFKDDDVLQENIIIMLEKNGTQNEVTISYSSDDCFSDLEQNTFPFSEIVNPKDSELFIHIPNSRNADFINISPQINKNLAELGIQVSTGPIVDFRVKDYIKDNPEILTVPLLYPAHFQNHSVHWPNKNNKKPNAILINSDTNKWLFPNGFYVVTRRFSSKEEKKRIIANIVTPSSFENYDFLGFENHLNVFHHDKNGLPKILAYGLYTYLNASIVDEHFRRFSGHTQVNATDLRNMVYPDYDTLLQLGEWALSQDALSQESIDLKTENIFNDR